MSRLLKPTKRQKAIVDLLSKIDEEGLDHALVDSIKTYDLLKIAEDQNLTDLVLLYEKTANNLEEYLLKLEKEVEPFREDSDGV